MISKFAFFGNLLLASVALGAPSSDLGARSVRREEHQPGQRAGVASNATLSSYAGAYVNISNDTPITNVTATFTVPVPKGESGGSSVGIAIDAMGCPDNMIQVGVEFNIVNDVLIYSGAFSTTSNGTEIFADFPVYPEQTVTVTLSVQSSTSAVATVENLTSGGTISRNLTISSPLCQTDVSWLLGQIVWNGSLLSVANFSSVAIQNATANNGAFTPFESGAQLLDMEVNDRVVATASNAGVNLSITYQ